MSTLAGACFYTLEMGDGASGEWFCPLQWYQRPLARAGLRFSCPVLLSVILLLSIDHQTWHHQHPVT